MKIFLSHNMSGLSKEEINDIRLKAISYLSTKYNDIIIIDNYNHEDAPENAGRLWHLGRSIQQLEEADAIYFCKDNCDSIGCEIEFKIADLYNLKRIT